MGNCRKNPENAKYSLKSTSYSLKPTSYSFGIVVPIWSVVDYAPIHVSSRNRLFMRFLSAFLLAVLLSGSMALAQNESGVRDIPNAELFKKMGYWYDSTTAMYQTRYPIIRNIPPIAPSMPLDILFAYVATDSLCRFGNTKAIHALVKNWEGMNDTLGYAAKWVYRMVDYNPIIFQQYEDQITYLRNDPFKTSLSSVRSDVEDKYLPFVPQVERNAVYSLMASDYILRVRVTAIDSMQHRRINDLVRYRVTAQVLDTLKGHVFQTCGYNPNPSIAAAAPPCMQFQYTSNNYRTGGEALFVGGTSPYIPRYTKQDSAFVQGWEKFGMTVGQEAIVFLSFGNRKVDYENDYYDLDISQDCSYNALPIIDGKVRDVNAVWSQDLWLPYSDWKARLNEIRNKILNAAY